LWTKRSQVAVAKAGGLFVLSLDRFVDLFAMYGDVRRGGDTKPNLVTPDVNDRQLDLIADHDRFVALT
jgi:hypothetical protein